MASCGTFAKAFVQFKCFFTSLFGGVVAFMLLEWGELSHAAGLAVSFIVVQQAGYCKVLQFNHFQFPNGTVKCYIEGPHS